MVWLPKAKLRDPRLTRVAELVESGIEKTWYAIPRNSSFGQRLLGFVLGGGHWVAHMIAMFALSLGVVAFSNSVAPAIPKRLTAIYGEDTAPATQQTHGTSLDPISGSIHLPPSPTTMKGAQTAG